MSNQHKLSWGILGCGGIATKFCSSMEAVEGGSVLACASRTPGKGKSFAEKHHIPHAFDDYGDLLARDDIQAVYVATTHNFHYENVMQALEAGKNVLCEKPLAVTGQQARAMVAKAREKKLFLMEAMWTRFLPAVVQMKRWLEEGRIGELKMMRADFCFGGSFPPEHRLLNPDLAGGALLDVGIYPVSMASFVMGGAPESVVALADIGKTGVDEQSAYLFRYTGGRMALLSSAVTSRSDNRVEIAGTTGRIVIPSSFFSTQHVELHPKHGDVIRVHEPYEDAQGFAFEIRAAQNAILSGQTECTQMPLDETVAIAETMDRILAQF